MDTAYLRLQAQSLPNSCFPQVKKKDPKKKKTVHNGNSEYDSISTTLYTLANLPNLDQGRDRTSLIVELKVRYVSSAWRMRIPLFLMAHGSPMAIPHAFPSHLFGPIMAIPWPLPIPASTPLLRVVLVDRALLPFPNSLS